MWELRGKICRRECASRYRQSGIRGQEIEIKEQEERGTGKVGCRIKKIYCRREYESRQRQGVELRSQNGDKGLG